MQSFEFLAAFQRLTLIAQMVEQTDIPGILEHLVHAETVTPFLTGAGPEGIAELRRFAEKASEFQAACMESHDRLAAAATGAGRGRRFLVGAEPPMSSGA